MNFKDYKTEIKNLYNDFWPIKSFNEIKVNPVYDYSFNIVIEFSNEINFKITQFNKKLNSIIPTTPYSAENIHVTIAVFRGHEMGAKVWIEEKPAIERLSIVAEKMVSGFKKNKLKIKTNKMLVNPEGTVLTTIPNQDILNFLNTTNKNNDDFLRLRVNWRSHITTGRFIYKSKNKRKIIQILDLVNNFDFKEDVVAEKITITKFKIYPSRYDLYNKIDFFFKGKEGL